MARSRSASKMLAVPVTIVKMRAGAKLQRRIGIGIGDTMTMRTMRPTSPAITMTARRTGSSQAAATAA